MIFYIGSTFNPSSKLQFRFNKHFLLSFFVDQTTKLLNLRLIKMLCGSLLTFSAQQKVNLKICLKSKKIFLIIYPCIEKRVLYKPPMQINSL